MKLISYLKVLEELKNLLNLLEYSADRTYYNELLNSMFHKEDETHKQLILEEDIITIIDGLLDKEIIIYSKKNEEYYYIYSDNQQTSIKVLNAIKNFTNRTDDDGVG